MGLDLHTIEAVDGSDLVRQDRVLIATNWATPFYASANSVTSVGSITAGSGGLAPFSLAFTGGTGSGARAAPIMKALTAVVAIGGVGYAANDTITLPGGIVLTVSTVTAGVITAAAVTTAGSNTNPQAAPLSQVSTSGSGAAAQFTFTWGLLGAQMLNSGNYSGAPTGITVTGAGGTFGAAGTPALGGNGAGVFVWNGFILPASYGVQATPSVPAFPSCPYKSISGFAVELTPIVASATLAAGTLDAMAVA